MEKSKAIEILKRRRQEVDGLDIQFNPNEFKDWRSATRIAIEKIFKTDADSNHVNELEDKLKFFERLPSFQDGSRAATEAVKIGFAEVKRLLTSMIDEVETYWPDGEEKITKSETEELLARLRSLAKRLDGETWTQQIERLEKAIRDDDTGLVIGTAKDLAETCYKTILGDIVIDKKWDLPKLAKETHKKLRLIPNDIPNGTKASETIKKLLSGLANIAQCLAELRNDYGTGHGREASSKGLSVHHAKLATGAAITLIEFLLVTYQEEGLKVES